ncbi:TniQ family protein [Trichocoleus sp. FACHB-832]|uniref:helix-turn-helix domain-containing protein n=1 Tax=Trichocoleus sp. FACHB-832 TaxID=2692875 RepID=UPI00168253A2|nr:helix-turn-helix transcriptional regulator [Trichocoleus sp. FACHB-832]MBD1904085.1 TniQ family protein [Trichocoleus sp. FACHB-832]
MDEIQPWLFAIAPLDGESLSHFLGRFRRENNLSVSRLGREAGIGAVVARWEKFYLNPFPSRKELEALAKVVQVDADRLREMLPPEGVGMKHEPIRLCGACYPESPYHKIEWQFKTTQGCVGVSHRHKLTLLSECPNCGARFKIPALWANGWCQRCFMEFGKMATYQKLI